MSDKENLTSPPVVWTRIPMAGRPSDDRCPSCDQSDRTCYHQDNGQ